MNTVNLTCIGCPLGCQIEVMMGDDGEILLVTGNTCARGESYARKEVTAPTRIVTSSVRVYGSRTGERMVSLKTASDIPKDRIMDVIYTKYLGTPLSDDQYHKVKSVDRDMLYYDLLILLNEKSDRPEPVMYSKFNYEPRLFEDVEKQYLDLFNKLYPLVSSCDKKAYNQ